MIEKWFVIFLVVTQFINLGIALGKHGEPRKEKYNGWVAMVGTAIFFTLAWLGGVFRCFE